MTKTEAVILRAFLKKYQRTLRQFIEDHNYTEEMTDQILASVEEIIYEKKQS